MRRLVLPILFVVVAWFPGRVHAQDLASAPLQGTMGLRLDVSAPPFKMDLLQLTARSGRPTTANTFRLNYVEKGGKDPRPTSFTTSEKTEESIVTLRRDRPSK